MNIGQEVTIKEEATIGSRSNTWSPVGEQQPTKHTTGKEHQTLNETNNENSHFCGTNFLESGNVNSGPNNSWCILLTSKSSEDGWLESRKSEDVSDTILEDERERSASFSYH